MASSPLGVPSLFWALDCARPRLTALRRGGTPCACAYVLTSPGLCRPQGWAGFLRILCLKETQAFRERLLACRRDANHRARAGQVSGLSAGPGRVHPSGPRAWAEDPCSRDSCQSPACPGGGSRSAGPRSAVSRLCSGHAAPAAHAQASAILLGPGLGPVMRHCGALTISGTGFTI